MMRKTLLTLVTLFTILFYLIIWRGILINPELVHGVVELGSFIFIFMTIFLAGAPLVVFRSMYKYINRICV